MAVEAVPDEDRAMGQVDRLDVADEDGRALQQRAQRADNVRDVEVTRRHLVQHRCEEKEILAADERNFHSPVLADEALEMQGRVNAAEPAAEHQNSRLHQHLPPWLDVGPQPRFQGRPV